MNLNNKIPPEFNLYLKDNYRKQNYYILLALTIIISISLGYIIYLLYRYEFGGDITIHTYNLALLLATKLSLMTIVGAVIGFLYTTYSNNLNRIHEINMKNDNPNNISNKNNDINE